MNVLLRPEPRRSSLVLAFLSPCGEPIVHFVPAGMTVAAFTPWLDARAVCLYRDAAFHPRCMSTPPLMANALAQAGDLFEAAVESAVYRECQGR